MSIIIDVESSSLSALGIPVQIALKKDEVTFHCYININQIKNSFDWSKESECVHGLSKSFLQNNGIAPERVCNILNNIIGKSDEVYSDSIFDEIWMKNLFSSCGIDRMFSIKEKALKEKECNLEIERHFAHHDVLKLH